MEFLLGLAPVLIPVFIIMCGTYFTVDILYLARRNDALIAENKKLKKRLRELER